MIQWNELRIVNGTDGQKLYIEVSIPDKSYYNDVYIDNIKIEKKYSGDASNAIYTYQVEETENIKILSLCIDNNTSEGTFVEGESFDFNNDLLFVYVETRGDISGDIPCDLNSTLSMRTVCNLFKVYKESMGYIRELEKECSSPDNFIDFILRLHAFNICIKTGNYRQAEIYWKKFFVDKKDCPLCNLN